MSETIGTIPQSQALAEAKPESMAELLSRDPFGYTEQDRGRIVALLREQRQRFERAEAEGKGKPRAASAKVKTLETKASSEDLGL